jgi:hypothetical protein
VRSTLRNPSSGIAETTVDWHSETVVKTASSVMVAEDKITSITKIVRRRRNAAEAHSDYITQ